MNPNSNGQANQIELTEEALNKKFTLAFTRKELTVLFNIMMAREYRLPDAEMVLGIVEKIKGPVVALTNQDYKKKDATPPEVAVN